MGVHKAHLVFRGEERAVDRHTRLKMAAECILWPPAIFSSCFPMATLTSIRANRLAETTKEAGVTATGDLSDIRL